MGLFDWNKQPDRDDDQAEDPGDYLVDPPGLWAADGGPHPDDEDSRPWWSSQPDPDEEG